MTRQLMDSVAIADFLAGQATGVLALADGDDAYAVPVSFAFDADESAVYFRLGYGTESRKRSFVDSTARATFVVHGETAAGWQSVVAEGPLTVVSETSLDTAIAEAVRDLDIPYFDVHADQPADLDLTVVRLDPDSLSGVAEGGG